MSDVAFYYRLLKMGALLVFCFAGGGLLIYMGVKDKKGPIAFEDVFPGLAAIAAGVILVGLFVWLSRPDKEEPESVEGEVGA